MRVTFASALDNFSCQRGDCLCRSVRTSPPQPGHPGRAATLAALENSPGPGNSPPWNDFPLQAVQTADGASLTFSTLCPVVRARLLAAEEPVTPAHSEGGWRQPLQVWKPDGKPHVLLFADCPVPFPAFLALRDALLDLAAEPTLPILGRLTRLAMTFDAAQHSRALPAAPPTLTPRGFLAFRAFLEARCASADPERLGSFAARARHMLPELALADTDLPRLLDALTGEWREQVRQWLVPGEREQVQVFETWLGARLLALPFDRDVSLARAWAELLESAAVAIRFAGALGELRQEATSGPTLLAALALAEHCVATAELPLPPFELPRDLHDRGPRMADLDMSLEAIC